MSGRGRDGDEPTSAMSTQTASTRTGRAQRAACYAEAMNAGRAQYRDVLSALATVGLFAEFTQTGGMCAAIDAVLDGGAVLLVTDAEDTLAWDRAEHHGWYVVLWPRGYQDTDAAPLAEASTPDGSVAALLALVAEVLTSTAIAPAVRAART